MSRLHNSDISDDSLFSEGDIIQSIGGTSEVDKEWDSIVRTAYIIGVRFVCNYKLNHQVKKKDEVGFITDSEMYYYELKFHKALALCDSTLRNFVVQDFSSKTHSLIVRLWSNKLQL